MNPFEQMQSLADLWAKSGKAFATAQQGLFSGMADTMAKAAGAGDQASFQAFAPDTQGFEAARQDFSKLWASASELSSALTHEPARRRSGQPAHGRDAGQDLRPARMVLGHQRGRPDAPAHGGGAAAGRPVEHERKFMAVFNAWVAMRRHSLEHNKVMLEAWLKAAGAFAKTLNERAERGETLESSREVHRPCGWRPPTRSCSRRSGRTPF